MVEPRGGLRLAQHAGTQRVTLVLGEGLGEGDLLDGDLAVEQAVVGEPHHPDPAPSNGVLQQVAARDNSPRHKGHRLNYPSRLFENRPGPIEFQRWSLDDG